MQSKLYNSYRITHKSGTIEEVNAESLIEALNSMSIKEEFDPVLQTYMYAQGIRTLVADLPEVVPFTAVVNDEAGGSIATPVSGNVSINANRYTLTFNPAVYSSDTANIIDYRHNGKYYLWEISKPNVSKP